MRCYRCESEIKNEEHHVHPRFMNNKNGEGIKITLCKDCHTILHRNIIPSFLFNQIENKEKAISDLKSFTFRWIGKNTEDKQLICSECKADLDIEDKICPYCNKLVGDYNED